MEEPSISSFEDENEGSEGDEVSILEYNENINPEGYGIGDEFIPTAAFETSEEQQTPTEDAVNELEKGVNEEESEYEYEGEMLDEGEYEGEYEIEEEIEEGEEEQEIIDITGELAKDEEEAIQARKKGKGKKDMFKKGLSVKKKIDSERDEVRFKEEEEQRISGDFNVLSEDVLGRVTLTPSIESFSLPSDERSSTELETVVEEQEPVDRESYYNIYCELLLQKNFQKMKNNLLQRKMTEYFRKKKMEHVLKETDNIADSQYKYDKKLDAFGEFGNLDKRERDSITSELNDLTNQRNERRTCLEESFSTMQNREKEIGSGLINTKTGKEIPDKLIERLLKRQKLKSIEVAFMRLTYIKIRNRVAEKKATLHALDNIGENLHLIDYEQLKIENQSHTDKIEERDEELTKLRSKCKGAIQCLAHIREKSAALQIDLMKLNDRLDDVESEVNDCRERLTGFKLERDYFRFETEKLNERAGILGKPKLLCDLEDSKLELKQRTGQLEKLKAENAEIKKNLIAIKQNIQEQSFRVTITKKQKVAKSKPKIQRVYRGRPTLIYPELPESDWDSTFRSSYQSTKF